MASDSFVPSSKASSLGSSSGWSKDKGEQMRTAKKNGCQMVPRSTKQRVSCLPVHFTSILSNLSMLSIPSKCGAMMSHVIDPDFLICKRCLFMVSDGFCPIGKYFWYHSLPFRQWLCLHVLKCHGGGSNGRSLHKIAVVVMSGYGLNLSQPDLMPAVFVKLNFLGYQLWTNWKTCDTQNCDGFASVNVHTTGLSNECNDE